MPDEVPEGHDTDQLPVDVVVQYHDAAHPLVVHFFDNGLDAVLLEAVKDACRRDTRDGGGFRIQALGQYPDGEIAIADNTLEPCTVVIADGQ